MITIPVEYIVIALIITLLVLWALIDSFIIAPIRYYIFDQRLYKYTKIRSYGATIVRTKWCKSDEEALTHYDRYEFVECIYPVKHEKKIKPSS